MFIKGMMVFYIPTRLSGALRTECAWGGSPGVGLGPRPAYTTGKVLNNPDVLALRLSHCPATLPLPPLVKRLSLRVSTLLLLRATI